MNIQPLGLLAKTLNEEMYNSQVHKSRVHQLELADGKSVGVRLEDAPNRFDTAGHILGPSVQLVSNTKVRIGLGSKRDLNQIGILDALNAMIQLSTDREVLNSQYVYDSLPDLIVSMPRKEIYDEEGRCKGKLTIK